MKFSLVNHREEKHMKKYHLQIYYHEQDGPIVDTVSFVVPDSIAPQQFWAAVDTINKEYAQRGTLEDDYLDTTDAMLDGIAEVLDGKWEYTNIAISMYVGLDSRELSTH